MAGSGWSDIKHSRDGKSLVLTTTWTKDSLKACQTTSTSGAKPNASRRNVGEA
jgi:hypothetical protein